MGDLEKIGPRRLLGDEFLHLPLKVAGQQRAGIAVGNEKGERIIVHGPVLRMPIGWRREHANVSATPIEGVTSHVPPDHKAGGRCSPIKALEAFDWGIDAYPEVSWMKIFDRWL